MTLKKILLTLCYIISTVTGGYTQTYPLINLTAKDGLPSNTIYSIFRDKTGYLWIATDKGVARFNGSKFELFTTFNGLPDNEVFGFTEDYEGRLWIVCFNGNLCFFKDGIFHNAKNTPWLKLGKNASASHHLEKDSSLTLSVTGGRYFLSIKHNKIKYFDLEKVRRENNIVGNDVSTVRKRSAARYEVFTSRKRLIIDTSGNTLSAKAYNMPGGYGNVSSPTGIYLYSPYGIFTLDETPVYNFDPISVSNRLFFFCQDNRNTFLCFRNGMVINKSKRILDSVFTTSVTNSNSYYWISTWDEGIYLLSQHLDNLLEWQNAYRGKVKTSRIINGKLYLIPDSGDLILLDSGGVKTLFKQPANSKPDPLETQFFIGDDLACAGLSFRKNYMIIPDGRYRKKDISDGLWKTEQEAVKEILSNGRYTYIFTIGGIVRTDMVSLKEGKSSNELFLVRSNGITSRIYSRAIDPKDNSVWFSRADGLYKIKDTVIERQLYKGYTYRKLSFYDQYLVGIADNNKIIIRNLEPGKLSIDSISVEDCIWENIYPIDGHRAIISTNNYHRVLTLLPPAKNGRPAYTVQTIEDPFVPVQAEYIVADSEYCFFFKEGTITRIKTSVLFEKISPPVPVFSSFKADDRSYIIRPEITIPYERSKNISIGFDNISFVAKKVTCEYSISDNGNDDWHEITGNEINLNTPGYGTYIIKIRSGTLSSGYSPPAVITLVVQKPFWATWWFITIAALVLLGIIWAIIILVSWRRLRKKQKEHDADMKFQQSEYKALNALMNPHFIFNSLNNIQGLINKDEKRTANQFLVIFSDLIRQNMHNISKGFISLQEELTLIENYLTLEKLRFKELVNYEINIDEEVDAEDIIIPPLMIQPLVENAVKHGLLPLQSDKAKVSIRVYEREDVLCIVVEDNGIGLTASLKAQNKLHDSFGLANLKKRTEHLKKIQQHELTIEVTERKDENGKVLGTTAVVTIHLD